MATWFVRCGDLLEVPADVLICSANVYLTLSGGVGGAFLLRNGPAMQEALYGYLRDRAVRHVPRGTVVVMPPCGSPYRAVLHAVAVDGAYESSPNVISKLLAECLCEAAQLEAKDVALAALATGYGRLTIGDFAQAIGPLLHQDFPPIARIIIGLRNPHDVDELLQLVPEIKPL